VIRIGNPLLRRPSARLGLVLQPSRVTDEPLRELRRWAARYGGALVQIRAAHQQRSAAQPGRAEDCDLPVSIGGDGTALAAIHAGAAAARPVLAWRPGASGP
jgi:NAD+ kinase